MSKKTPYLAAAFALLAITAAAACGTIIYQNNKPGDGTVIDVDNTPSNPNIETNVKSNGIGVKFLNHGKNGLGQITYTFSYTIEPATATDQTVSATLAWNSSSVTSDIADYLTVSVDTDNKTITITALQNFGNKATLTVTSNSNYLQYATVDLDCLKKFNGWNSNGTNAYGQTTSGIALRLSTYSGGNYSNNTVNYKNLPSTLTDYTLPSANTTNSGHWEVSYADCSMGFTSVYTKDVNISLGWSIDELFVTNNQWSFVMYGSSQDSTTHYVSAYNETSSFSSYFSGQTASMGSEVNMTGSNLNVSNIRTAIQTAINGLPGATRLALYNHYASTNSNAYVSNVCYFGVSTLANLTYAASTGETMTRSVAFSFIDYADQFDFRVAVTGVSCEVDHLDF